MIKALKFKKKDFLLKLEVKEQFNKLYLVEFIESKKDTVCVNFHLIKFFLFKIFINEEAFLGVLNYASKVVKAS